MKSIHKFKNVLPLLLGIVTTLICISLCVFIDIYADISIESVSVLFVIPVGAIILGAICGCGLICGLRILNIRIKSKHYIISSILGAAGFIGIYIGLYIAISQKYGIIISVNEFLDKLVLNRVTTFSIGSNISRAYKMGATYGVIKTIIELIGFIIGGFIIIRLMKKNGSSYSEVEEVRQLIRISKNSVTELVKVL